MDRRKYKLTDWDSFEDKLRIRQLETDWDTEKWTDRQPDRWTHRHTDWETERLTDWYTDRFADRQLDTWH